MTATSVALVNGLGVFFVYTLVCLVLVYKVKVLCEFGYNSLPQLSHNQCYKPKHSTNLSFYHSGIGIPKVKLRNLLRNPCLYLSVLFCCLELEMHKRFVIRISQNVSQRSRKY